MPHPVRECLAANAAVILSLVVIPLGAQAGAGLL